MQSLPLSGVRVLSFESVGAGPYATMLMASMGAEVFRIEPPAGDPARRTPPLTLGENDSLYFQSLNLNKKSIVLDLKSLDQRSLFHELVGSSDAVMNNLRGNQPKKLGLDYSSLKHINPQIVCGHISAYGRNNSRSDWPGFDFLMQAEAGLMDLTGDPGSPPTRAGVSFIDYMTGMMLAFGVVSALRQANQSGVGCDIDASLFDTAIHQLCYQGTWYLNEQIVTKKTPRSSHPTLTPVQLFRTRDGWIYVAAMSDKFWCAFAAALGRHDLIEDPRFLTHDMRTSRREELTDLLDGILQQRPTLDWLELLNGAVPAAPVYSLAAALQNPFLEEAELIETISHPADPQLKVLSCPLRVNGRRPQQARAPLHGEHSKTVQREARRALRTKE